MLEYIQGQSLRHYLNGQLKLDQSIRIMRDVLSGVAAAHAQNIIHCDIKPANILLNGDGQAKVADFGLAQLAGANRGDDSILYGTPQYMAPEYIETRRQNSASDVFSIGLVFYEMLTGKTAVDGADIYQILYAISNSSIAAPSKTNKAIDERLDALILKSLDKDPQRRFADAGAMLKAFNDYLSFDDEARNTDSSDSTINFLLRRMRHKKDFPVFSQTINILNQASSSETESLTLVSNAILKDYSLTNKVLRLVNSAYYNRGSEKISTISRAVVMLGIDAVRSIAASLMLFDHLQNKLQAHQLKEDAVQSLFSALVANDLMVSLGKTNHEEAFLCALLQQLGKMLVRFYLHEESRTIDKLIAQGEIAEPTAVTQVLGTSYHRLGIAVAREWGFPESIVSSMEPVNFNRLPPEKNDSNNLRLVSHFSNALGNCLSLPPDQQSGAISQLTRQFSSVLDIDKDKVSLLVETSQEELVKFSKLIQFDLKNSRYIQQIPSGDGKGTPLKSGQTQIAELDSAGSIHILQEDLEEQIRTTDKTLTDGIQDVTNTLTGEYSLNQIMQMILEIIYRALPGSRVVLSLKDGKSNCIRARFGFGEDVDRIIRNFSIPLAYQADVFHISFKNNVDIQIKDSQDENIRGNIPQWYHEEIGAKGFTIFPIIIKHSPIAMIYIDGADGATISLTDNQLGLIKTLRNQAILAIKNLQ